MPTSTTFELPGYMVERSLGLSWGLIVRSVGLTKGLTGTVRSLKAGEVMEFTPRRAGRRATMQSLSGHPFRRRARVRVFPRLATRASGYERGRLLELL
jgi:uncharacterized protein YbjQ (UPF0145 family)